MASERRNRERSPRRSHTPAVALQGFHLRKYGRFWALYDAHDVLIVVTVYRKGALEVIKRLEATKLPPTS
jgi:hypothetical protein